MDSRGGNLKALCDSLYESTGTDSKLILDTSQFFSSSVRGKSFGELRWVAAKFCVNISYKNHTKICIARIE